MSILIWTLVWNLKREKMWTIFFRMKLDELWRWNYLCWKQKLISEIAVYQKRRPVKCGILLNEVQTPKRNFFKFQFFFCFTKSDMCFIVSNYLYLLVGDCKKINVKFFFWISNLNIISNEHFGYFTKEYLNIL